MTLNTIFRATSNYVPQIVVPYKCHIFIVGCSSFSKSIWICGVEEHSGRKWGTIPSTFTGPQNLRHRMSNITWIPNSIILLLIELSESNSICIHIIIQINNNVRWDWQDFTEHSRIFPTFKLNVGNTQEYFMEYWQSHGTLLWIWIMLCRKLRTRLHYQ